MKKFHFILASMVLFVCVSFQVQAKISGIFYSTLFLKTGEFKRATNLGDGAEFFFLGDVNGDKKNDAVCIYTHGEKSGAVELALSDGTFFSEPKEVLRFLFQWDYVKVLAGDFNGDKRMDLAWLNPVMGCVNVAYSGGDGFENPIYYDLGVGQRRNGDSPLSENPHLQSAPIGDCYVGDMNGDGNDDLLYTYAGKWFAFFKTEKGFSESTLIYTPDEENRSDKATRRLCGDVNGDGRDDVILWSKKNKSLDVLLSQGNKLENPVRWSDLAELPNGATPNRLFAEDIDGDGKSDVILWDRSNWFVYYSDGERFSDRHHWISGNFLGEHKYNQTSAEEGMIGKINGITPSAVTVSHGKWRALENPNKNTTVNPASIDIWETWGCSYEPSCGIYDPYNQEIVDNQLKLIYDAEFDYIMFDITNGAHGWVDDRALFIMGRIREFNRHLQPGQRRLYACVAMGASGGNPELVERESVRAWNQFYEPFKEIYHIEEGKPLLINFIGKTEYIAVFEEFRKTHQGLYSDRFELRWMLGGVLNRPECANGYGWPIPEKFGNPFGDKMMAVMPGFHNGAMQPVLRENGDFYRSQWMRVVQLQPASVFLNSFNEYWEHTATEPAHLLGDKFVADPSIQPWTDYYGDPMDDFYWEMTRRYNYLYKHGNLMKGSVFQRNSDPEKRIYLFDGEKEVLQNELPHQMPVLLLP